MISPASAAPPRGPYLVLLVAWIAGTAAIGLATLEAWRNAPPGLPGLIAQACWVFCALAQSVALYYLLGFVLKSLHYMFMAPVPAQPGALPAHFPAPGQARPVVVLYLTAGDFDATALDSLLYLRSDGPRLLVVHDDGNDSAARRAIEAFIEQHPARAGWEVSVLHRPERVGGKAGAVNWVLEQLDPRWELMLLCDSDSIALDADALRRAAPDFRDSRIAVVQFRNCAYSEPDDSPFVRRIAHAIDVFDAFAAPQSAWGYLPFFGHNALVRVGDLRALGGLTPGFFSDDLDLSVRLTLARRRITYRRDIAFAERHPADWLAFRKRARKWAFGCMQVIRARAWSVLTAPGIPLPHRLGLLEFMGFYPAQALLVAGLLLRHLVLPWIQVEPAHQADIASGAIVTAALLLPTFAWAWQTRNLRAWPGLAWSCVLVYGGSILATVHGVVDGLSTRPRPWVPTNLLLARPLVPQAAWGECLLGIALVLVPWWRQDGLLDSPASYLFAATFFLAPLTAAAYGERRAEAHPDAASARTLSSTVALLALALAGAVTLALAGPARAEPVPRLTVAGTELRLDGHEFRFRGVHYSPWLPGTGPGGTAAYPGPNVVDRDLDRIRDLGANAILIDGAPAWVAQHAAARGMVSIYSFNIAWNDTSEAAFQLQSARIVAAVDSLRGTPGIVAWLLGHEMPDWVVADLGAPRVEGRLRELAARTKQADPVHLLGHGNWPPTRQLDLSFLDLACFNLYPAWPYDVAVRGYGPYLRDVLLPAARGRPLLISEFGINSLEAGEARQAVVLTDCWHEIETSHTAGGVVFEWCDEWWKNYDNPISSSDFWKRKYDPTDASRQDRDPEEYYGIVRADRSPKPALAAVRRMWHGGRGARSWVPWGAVALLAVSTLLLFRGKRRTGPRTEQARSVAILGLIAFAFLLAGSAGRAQAAAWSSVDTLESPAEADAQYGWTIGNAGDLDADGRNETAVGAHFAAVGPLAAAGKVFLYRGGWAQGTPAWLVLAGGQANEHFGESIAGNADVDGDGHPDLAVGAPLRSSGGFSSNGGVEIYRGGSVAGGPWAVLAGEASDDWFGQSIALGDLDGDGKADIAVGAPYNDRGGSAAGAVFIYRGGATPPAAPWKVLTGQAANDQFGWSVACVGDVNGDGYGDLVVGARLHGIGLSASAGRVYLFFGGPAMSTASAGSWDGEAKDDWFGNSVAGPGDVDGGGRPDILVGAPYNDRGGSAAGAAFLFRGEDPPGSPPLTVFTGASANAQFGWAVAGPGDVDGDGRPDVLAGARQQADGANLAAGSIYLYAGAAHPSTVAEATAIGEAAHDWFGNSVGGAWQFLTTGRAATLAGAPFADGSGSATGRAYAFGLGPLVAVSPGVGGSVSWRALPNPASAMTRLVETGGIAGSPLRIEIFDAAGRLVRTLPASGGAGPVPTWDLRDEAGHRVREGLYLARISGVSSPPATLKLVVAR